MKEMKKQKKEKKTSPKREFKTKKEENKLIAKGAKDHEQLERNESKADK